MSDLEFYLNKKGGGTGETLTSANLRHVQSKSDLPNPVSGADTSDRVLLIERTTSGAL